LKPDWKNMKNIFKFLLAVVVAIIAGGAWGFVTHLLFGPSIITSLGTVGIGMLVVYLFYSKKEPDQDE